MPLSGVPIRSVNADTLKAYNEIDARLTAKLPVSNAERKFWERTKKQLDEKPELSQEAQMNLCNEFLGVPPVRSLTEAENALYDSVGAEVLAMARQGCEAGLKMQKIPSRVRSYSLSSDEYGRMP